MSKVNRSTPLISMQNISIRIGAKCILDKVSCKFHSGQLTVILGPNGTGKSSLLKTLSNEIAYTGENCIMGIPTHQWKKAELANHFGVLPQSSSLTFNFKAREVVELGGHNLKIRQKEVEAIARKNMEKTQVLHLAEHDYPTLSGGEKQRVHLARVLTQLSSQEKPPNEKILFLDEPTSALDLSHQHNTLKLAKLMSEEGACVIAVLHDLNLAAQYADRIIILNQGRIAADGTPWEVLTSNMLEQVYGWKTAVIEHPLHHHPVILSAA